MGTFVALCRKRRHLLSGDLFYLCLIDINPCPKISGSAPYHHEIVAKYRLHLRNTFLPHTTDNPWVKHLSSSCRTTIVVCGSHPDACSARILALAGNRGLKWIEGKGLQDLPDLEGRFIVSD